MEAERDAGHWRTELVEWLDEVAEIRLGPNNSPAPASFYFRILFDEPFGGTDVANLARRIRRLERQHCRIREDMDLDLVLQRLREFHIRFSDACSRAISTDEIQQLLRHAPA